jgi:cyclopropane fatty-acyl-phospholipid synthase-like methyltransferase
MDWSEIWQKKANEHNQGDVSLEEILRVNGYDVKYAETNTNTIREYVAQLAKKLELTKGNSLLEVGSGAGAISIPMAELGIKVTGFDPCEDLIHIAAKALPTGNFFVDEAATFDHKKKDFDAVLSQGVFQFFPSEEYGAKSFQNMLAHARKGGIVGITDLLNKDNEQALMDERIRLLGEEEFKRKYVDTGLQHQFYHQDTFIQAAQGLCSKVWIEDQFLENATGDYKYNVFAIR